MIDETVLGTPLLVAPDGNPNDRFIANANRRRKREAGLSFFRKRVMNLHRLDAGDEDTLFPVIPGK